MGKLLEDFTRALIPDAYVSGRRPTHDTMTTLHECNLEAMLRAGGFVERVSIDSLILAPTNRIYIHAS